MIKEYFKCVGVMILLLITISPMVLIPAFTLVYLNIENTMLMLLIGVCEIILIFPFWFSIWMWVLVWVMAEVF